MNQYCPNVDFKNSRKCKLRCELGAKMSKIDLNSDIPLRHCQSFRGMVQALTIAELYRERWQVELFFRWIKQHLRIRAFYGTSPNAVKTEVWVAISVYV